MMDKATIADKAKDMKSKEDLLALLNYIKRSDMEESGMLDKFYPFTIRHINCYCNPNHAFHRYKQFKIKKKSGGFRQVTAPRNKSYKLILRYLNVILNSLYAPSDYAMGFCEGRSVVDNASAHVGRNYVFNTDLKDFFPSIDQARVWKRLQLAPFHFPQSIANIIAGLCCMKVVEKIDEKDVVRYVLPQGSPTSPLITNMVCDTLDHRLAGLAKRFGLSFTRYADDITFSSMHNVYQEKGEFLKELRRIISDQRFTINESKTRLQKLGSRQEVTGLIVSKKINVTQKYIRDLRNILYIWERYGYSVAFAKFFPKYRADKGHLKRNTPDMTSVLEGKLLYLKMVRGKEDAVYIRLKEKFERLTNQLSNPTQTNAYGITYVETIPILEFEQKNATTIEIAMSLKDNITKVSHRYAYFLLDSKKIYASVNKSITVEEEKQKDKLAISNCRDVKGKLFWLIHRIDKVMVHTSPNVDIDELNNDLDFLLDS